MATDPAVITTLLLLPRSERRGALQDVVTAEFKRVLLMTDEDELRPDQNYFDLGLTSLRATEVKQRLESELGCVLDTSLLFGSPTVKQIVDHLVSVALPDMFGSPATDAQPQANSQDWRLVGDLINELYTA